MFESKSIKSSTGQRKAVAVDKNVQRKVNFKKPIQHIMTPQNGVLGQLKKDLVQRIKPIDEEELLEEEEPLQMKRENNTGMPENLKSGIEGLSGMDMSDVRVHYNSSKPAGVGALAYTQGADIHVAPGQERHLAHEAWHVVQQAQGRVQPTTQLKDVSINDDPELELEADLMGQKALNG